MVALALSLSIILIAVLAVLWMIQPARPSAAMRTSLKGGKYAHRGLYDNTGIVPENSMKAFSSAIDKGYGIELDIRLTKDGQVVVFHDGTLERMCGIKKPVEDLSLSELKKLRLLGTDQAIPTFAEFLALVDGRSPLLIEYKTGLPIAGGDTAERLCAAAIAMLDAYKGPFVIESFDPLVLAWFKKQRPLVMRGQLGMGLKCYVPALGKQGAAAIPTTRKRMLTWLLCNHSGRPHFISYRFQDAGFSVSLCRALGAMVSVWTVKSLVDSEALLQRYDAVIFEGFLA